MTRLWNIKYRDLIKKLKKLWYEFYREWKWSHELWVNKQKWLVLPIPKHNSKDLRIWTLRIIIKELNINVEEFIDL
jgi:predicted RNA binding protein YcfA (HicA-like mRNA interferase family)